MSESGDDAPRRDDAGVVTWQLGRRPRGRWRVAARCRYGFPQAIETEPVLPGGEPFPTLYYLTCPYLVEAASAAESEGELARFDARASTDAAFAARMREAHEEVVSRRAAAARGSDPCGGVGAAGQRDPLATKCLHARIATALAGIGDPVGEAMIERVGAACGDARCDGRSHDGR
ncbi:DUF501 domain-containing protein [Coriobacteriia bacterium Es71-Z0120]|uniref:DUF501 domain-containing protein n=1 Tax=Parvivirga hydrogeniphila TaxID=2939460 RepID=UPI0022609EA9|nr:DUF501 domain-containing protein [Parvivirga hydrogeniphila]MCL4078402.1 DUF501 domain-containing protein [Parvivirga hydrogeniphila]